MKINSIWSYFLFLVALSLFENSVCAQNQLPDTGISGVYEVVVGATEKDYALNYFKDYGFTLKDSAKLSAQKANAIYNVPSAVSIYRMQNGSIDSHGLLRVMIWEKPIGEGVGYAAPETIGQRMAVMRTNDIFRIVDIYKAARKGGQKWLPIDPVADDLFDLDSKTKKDFFKRPVQVRETGIYGEFFNHVFFQRYGYHIPGYGSIEKTTPLKTSEFTHHDFIIELDSMEQMSYLSTALGLKAEAEPSIDGEWQDGPRVVFQMTPGYSHWYQGFVSPNNICGKLKFFIPRAPRPNRSAHQRLGEPGITMHTFYTPKLKMVHDLVKAHQLQPSKIQHNEFKESSFIFKGPEGSTWQIIERGEILHSPLTTLDFQIVNE